MSTADIAAGTTFTLSGAGSYVFLVPTALTANVGSNVALIGVDPCQVFWQVGSSATLNGLNFPGTVIAGAGSVTVAGGMNLAGRAVSLTAAVTMLGTGQIIGSCSGAPPTTTTGPVGSEFRVNTYTTSTQSRPAVAALGTAGDFVIVWQSRGSAGTDTSYYSIQGRRFASDGSAIGSDFQVNTYTTNSQYRPSVAARGTAGDFVVVWASGGSAGTDTSVYSIQGRRFASDGSAIDGSDFQVNTYTTNHQLLPSVTALGTAGNFGVVWESGGSTGTDTSGYSIQGRRFASDGSAIDGSDVQVNTYTTNHQWRPAVAALGTAGDFVVVWQSGGSAGTDTSNYSIQGRRFASDGSAIGSDFQVNTYTMSFQYGPTVAALGTSGAFVVAWQSNGSAGTDSSSYSIQGRRFASDGSGIGSDFQVNTFTPSLQLQPRVAALGTSGDFVVTWQSNGSAGDTSGYSIQGRRFASTGSGIGSDFQINTFTPSNQKAPAVAAVGTMESFVVAWESQGQDGSGYGIFGKILRPNTVTVTAPTSTTDRWSVGSTQRIRWDQTGGAAATFSVDLSRDGGVNFSNIGTNVLASTATAGNFYWTVDFGTYPEGAQVRVRSGAADDPTAGSGLSVLFSIDPAVSIVVKQPWQATLAPNVPITIAWNQNVGYRSRMKIELSTDGGSTYNNNSITGLTYSGWINRGTFPWTVPGSGTCGALGCKIKVSWLDGVGSGVSNPFTIP